MDAADEMTEVYEALVHWADVVLLATPIRWGKPVRSTSGWPNG